VYIGKQPSIAKSAKNTRIVKQTVCCIFCRIWTTSKYNLLFFYRYF